MYKKNKSIQIPEGREAQKKEAMQRAMRLLLYKDRSEWELRNRLIEDGFEEDAIEAAQNYVSSYGYINDKRYAENYVISRGRSQSVATVANDLRRKGIAEEYIQNALEENPIEEERIADELLRKRLGEPHIPEEKEKRRVFGYLARRGFAASTIMSAIRRYEASVNGI